MADEQNELKQVNWNELFGFTQIFKSFRMAIHPSKLLLALAAIVLVFLAGWVLDGLWSVAGQRVASNEIGLYGDLSPQSFDKAMEGAETKRNSDARGFRREARSEKRLLLSYKAKLGTAQLSDAFNKLLREADRSAPEGDEGKEEEWQENLDKGQGYFADEVERIESMLDDAYDDAEEQIDKISDKKKQGKAEKQLAKDYRAALQGIAERKVTVARRMEEIAGKTVFSALMDYEGECLRNAVKAVCYGNIFGGMDAVKQMVTRRAVPPVAPPAAGVLAPANPADERPGFVYYLAMADMGICWLITQHWLYAVIFLVVSLAICALLGGAVNRIAALHFAREEKISITQALKFSASKFLSFFMAPLIPLGIILILGLLLTAGGLLINLPWIGEIIAAVLFFLAIIAGLLIAFLLIGLVTGVWLMYPTIAVEGSDSFDAISRSYSYIFNRPWRAAWYAGVALVHGTVCYVFVRLFAFVVLKATHLAVGTGVWAGGEQVPGATDRLDAMWPAPTFEVFHAPMNSASMSTLENIGAILMAIWVYLVIGLVVAFLISYFISASTMIYFLLRRHVDATDLDDVFVEETEEEPLQLTDEADSQEADEEEKADSDG